MQNHNILVIGCGGTGGFVAEGLCRLLIGNNIPIVLIDYDRVEPHNLLRQNFNAEDVGKFKSEVLAKRLSKQYDRRIGYSVCPYFSGMIAEVVSPSMYRPLDDGIIIGCVDNAATRRTIAESVNTFNWWIDAGNGFSSGQVLIGNAGSIDSLKNSFDKESGKVMSLPIPSIQLPSLLIEQTKSDDIPMDCAEAVAAEEQSPVINQAMATLILEFMYRFLNGKLAWMGAYIDLDAGTLQSVPAQPETVAKMCGIKVDSLYSNSCSIGKRYSLRRR